MRKKFFVSLVLLAVFLPAYAEIVVLKSGKIIEGDIVEKTEKYIKVDMFGVPVTYYLDDIESINGKKITAAIVKKEPEVKAEINNTKEKINLELQDKKSLSLGEVKEAQECFQKGLNYFREKKYEESIIEFEKALKIDPNLAEGYYGLGYAYCSKDQCEASLEYFKKAIELSPNYVDAYNGMAYAYNILGKYENTIEYYLKVLQLKADNLDALNGLGYAYASMGKYEDAVSYFKKAIKINPEYAPSYSGLGVLYYSLGQFLDAKENFLKAKELFKKNNDEQGVKAIEEYLGKLP
ncbi:MAG: tetratricopeptide repeat protein [Candidatus Omnitrophica bacterium]|jgi:tetratricopeptide (TPR) repeat protein|nr:tetratricopeptide repeat protein [Candidatus Omnitrophota bacterium]